jgi:acetyl esterase/lipase/enterochelin esterase-like enzyme
MTTAAADIPDSITVSRDIVYATVGEQDLKLDIYWQQNSSEPLPLVVWIHGGAWRAGSKENPRALPLLSKNYAIASVQYRLSQEAISPAQIHDCKAAIRWLRANATQLNVDPDKIGVWGGSAGGHLVALLGTSGDVADLEGELGITTTSSRVQAVCDWFGPTDLLRMNDVAGKIDHNAPDSPESQLVGAPIQENPDLVERVNPITYVSSDDPPFLIMHGSQDLTVLQNQSELLHVALQQADVSSNLILIDDMGHGFRSRDKDPNDLIRHVEAFFDRELKGKQSEWTEHAKNPHPWVSDFGNNEPDIHDALFYSDIIGGYSGYTIYLPPSYRLDNERMYPAVYWLHGRNGRPHRSHAFISRARKAIARGLCPEMIIIAPTGLPASMYVDSKDGKHPIESVIVKELIPHIESTYRVIPDRDMRAIDGFSMGGFGAAHLGFKYPDLFGTISLMGAAVHHPEFFREERADIFANAFGDDLAYCKQESPWTLVRQNADQLRDRTTMRLFVGARDIRLRGKNMEFSTVMETLRLRHDYGVVPDAGHNAARVLDGIGDDAWTFYQQAFKVE